MSFRTTLQSQTTWKEGSLSLVKTDICLPLLPSVVTLHTILLHKINGKYKTCSVAWAGELSATCIFVMKLKQCGSSYMYPFSPFLVNFDVFLVPSDLSPYQCIVGRYSGDRFAKFSNLIYISSSIMYGTLHHNIKFG